MKNICINCRKEPVANKKRQLCNKCYRKLYYKNQLYNLHFGNINHESEMEFAKNFFNHKNWLYHPVVFRLNDTTYEPDFYDGKRNVFIEIAGTRQAFHANKKKYIDFTNIFKKLKFEVRKPSGELINVNDDKFNW